VSVAGESRGPAPDWTVDAGVSSESMDSDLALLRAHEPVVRYTRGELFLPTAVSPYVAQCSLWAGVRGGEQTELVRRGELTLERLSREGVARRDSQLFLRFVEKPLGRAQYLRWRRMPRERLSATGRFTTTGVFGRLIDAGIRASLLLRGKVPAGLAAAAETMYREQLDAGRFTYYGRVVRYGGYICLQYWLFYAMNDWRSTFGGVNDHEADWEMVTIYLAQRSDGPRQPAWVAFSSHDYHGDDLRRRWDDPELQREGARAVVFAGAGSHSGAFIPGDYVVSVDPPQVQAAMRFVRKVQRLLAPWRHYTGGSPGLGIPFVDYARGDGIAIGAGHDHQWTPVLIDDDTPWVRDYRGLWGLDTRDRFGGERAPSGPRYDRDGSVRTSWSNPLGWAGLLKVPPHDGDLAEALERRVMELDRELSELDATIEADRAALRGLRAQALSLSTHDYARALAARRMTEVADREAQLNQTIVTRTALAEERRAHLATLSQPIPAEPPQAHIRKPHTPYLGEQERRTRFLKLWAAVSTPLLLSSVIVVLLASPLAWITTIGVLIVAFAGVEAIARRRLLSFVASVLLLIATAALIVGLAVLFLKHWRTAISVLVGAAALVLLFGNLEELRRG
jgi:hypothetical protein